MRRPRTIHACWRSIATLAAACFIVAFLGCAAQPEEVKQEKTDKETQPPRHAHARDPVIKEPDQPKEAEDKSPSAQPQPSEEQLARSTTSNTSDSGSGNGTTTTGAESTSGSTGEAAGQVTPPSTGSDDSATAQASSETTSEPASSGTSSTSESPQTQPAESSTASKSATESTKNGTPEPATATTETAAQQSPTTAPATETGAARTPNPQQTSNAAETPQPPAPEEKESEAPIKAVLPARPDAVDLPELQGAQREEVEAEAGPFSQLRGRWTQVSDDNRADFLEGGYRSATLIFEPGGTLRIERYYDANRQLVLTRRVDIARTEAGLLRIGAETAPTKDELFNEAVTLPLEDGEQATITPPDDTLPVTVEFDLSDNELRLGGKRYRRAGTSDEDDDN